MINARSFRFVVLSMLLMLTSGCARANDNGTLEKQARDKPQHVQGSATTALKPVSGDNSLHLYSYRVVNTYPHDETAFTQGLFFHNDKLYESTGLNGQSTVRQVDLETGEIIRSRAIDPEYFGEGAVAIGQRLYSLSWQSGTGFVHDTHDLSLVEKFTYDGEGWGLTSDGVSLIMSDGTPTLRFLDPENFSQTRTIDVVMKGRAINKINELEWVGGRIFANLWMQDWIAIINPATGQISGLVDMTGLLPEAEIARMNAITGKENVLNGIAYKADEDRLFVTGKNWPFLYEIELVYRETR